MIKKILDQLVLRSNPGLLDPREFERFLIKTYDGEKVSRASISINTQIGDSAYYHLDNGTTLVMRIDNCYQRTKDNNYASVTIEAAGEENKINGLQLVIEEELCYKPPIFFKKTA